MAISRVRVTAKHMSANASSAERQRNFNILLAAFGRAVDNAGIMNRYKECQFYESKGEKRRRKAKETDFRVRQEKRKLAARLKDHFG